MWIDPLKVNMVIILFDQGSGLLLLFAGSLSVFLNFLHVQGPCIFRFVICRLLINRFGFLDQSSLQHFATSSFPNKWQNGLLYDGLLFLSLFLSSLLHFFEHFKKAAIISDWYWRYTLGGGWHSSRFISEQFCKIRSLHFRRVSIHDVVSSRSLNSSRWRLDLFGWLRR